jgi:hypothetical protein
LLVLLSYLPIQGDVLIDRKRFPSGVAGDELEFRIRQPGVPGEPSNALVPLMPSSA